MKTKLTLRTLALPAMLLSTLIYQPSTSFAQGTGFTYQGQLNKNGAPVNGACDLRFTVYDAKAAGNVIAGPLTVSPVDVTNGLFTVSIDFGANVFTGPARWLNIEVQPAGGGGFTPLAPRQEVTASPYAIRAASAGTAADVSAGSVVKSLNTLKDDVTLGAGSNVTITAAGNTLTIAAAGVGGSGIWSLNGGNTYYNAGKVGVGTTVPATALEVNGIARSTRSGNAAQYIQLDGGDPVSIRMTAQSIVSAEKSLLIQNLSGEATPGADNNIQFVLGTAASPSTKMTVTKEGNVILPLGGTGGGITIGTPNSETGMSIAGANRADVRFDGSTLKLLAGAGGGIPSSANGIAINTSGNVGIGTASPTSKLEIAAQDGLAITGFEPFLTLRDTSAGNARSIIQNGGGNLLFYPQSFVGGAPALTISSVSGDVGIGTTTPVAKLHAETSQANTAAVYGNATGSGGVGVYGQSASGAAVHAEGNAVQARDKGGFVKAMLYVGAGGEIIRCYNGQTGTANNGCGFSVSMSGSDYTIDFGFRVDDRFASVVPGRSGLAVAAANLYYGVGGPNTIGVGTRVLSDGGPGPADFTIIVY